MPQRTFQGEKKAVVLSTTLLPAENDLDAPSLIWESSTPIGWPQLATGSGLFDQTIVLGRLKRDVFNFAFAITDETENKSKWPNGVQEFFVVKIHTTVKTIVMFALCSLFALTEARSEESSFRKINRFRKDKVQKTSNSENPDSTKVEERTSPSQATQISPTNQIKQGFERLGQGTTMAISKTKGMLARNIKWPSLKRMRIRKSDNLASNSKKPERIAKRSSQKRAK